MVGISKRIRSSWVNSGYGIMKTATDTITTLPAVLYPTGTTATVGLKGNESHTGTPTTQNPVMPNGTGERTGNLFDKSTAVIGERIYTNRVASDAGWAHSDFIDITGIDFITVSRRRAGVTTFYFYADKTNQSISYYQGDTAEVPNNAKYVRINMYISDVNSNMLVVGSIAPTSYIPYGYKIPISSAGQTTPVYLGEVQTTRKINKYVFTGQETFYASSQTSVFYTTAISNLCNKTVTYSTGCLCNAYKLRKQSTAANLQDGEYTTDTNGYVWFRNYDYSTLQDFKAYLQQQYSNGTPVTVWYVLANEETAVVNEPLMKIGDYADEVANVSIPVTAGGDTLSVGTTVQPSEITVNYKGWHPVQSVHERENGAWT